MRIDISDTFVRLQILITEGGVADSLAADGDVRHLSRGRTWCQSLSFQSDTRKEYFSKAIFGA